MHYRNKLRDTQTAVAINILRQRPSSGSIDSLMSAAVARVSLESFSSTSVYLAKRVVRVQGYQ